MEVDDPVARQNWKKAVVPQVAELAIELQRDLLRLEAPGDLGERVVQALRFGRSELRFDRFVVSIANPQVNRLSNVSDAMQAVYERLHDGSLGEDRIARIDHFPGACVKCRCYESICSVGALHVDDGVDIAAIVDGSCEHHAMALRGYTAGNIGAIHERVRRFAVAQRRHAIDIPFDTPEPPSFRALSLPPSAAPTPAPSPQASGPRFLGCANLHIIRRFALMCRLFSNGNVFITARKA